MTIEIHLFQWEIYLPMVDVPLLCYFYWRGVIEFDTKKEGVVETPVMGDFPPVFSPPGLGSLTSWTFCQRCHLFLGHQQPLQKAYKKARVFSIKN